MRFGAFILAIMVLALSYMPCADDAFAIKAGKAQTSIIKTQDQQHNDHIDACSPFCQCTCCAGFPFTTVHFTTVTPVEYQSFLYGDPGQSDLIEISLPIWQPPQLS